MDLRSGKPTFDELDRMHTAAVGIVGDLRMQLDEAMRQLADAHTRTATALAQRDELARETAWMQDTCADVDEARRQAFRAGFLTQLVPTVDALGKPVVNWGFPTDAAANLAGDLEPEAFHAWLTHLGARVPPRRVYAVVIDAYDATVVVTVCERYVDALRACAEQMRQPAREWESAPWRRVPCGEFDNPCEVDAWVHGVGFASHRLTLLRYEL